MKSGEWKSGQPVARRSPWALGRMGFLVGFLFFLVAACSGQSPDATATAKTTAMAQQLPGICYQVQDLGPVFFDWGEGQTLGINPSGTVVGTTGASSAERRGFIYQGGTMTQLGTLGGLADVRAINARGLAVGGSIRSDGIARATSFYKGMANDLGALDETHWRGSWTMDVNAAGLAVGDAWLDGAYHAAAFYRGKVIDLGTPGYDAYATGVNDPGDIVGNGRRTADGAWEGFFIPAGGTMQILGDIEGVGSSSSANKVNNGSTVCGSTVDEDSRHAILLRNGRLTDLGPSVAYGYGECFDVSDSGFAVGAFTNPDWSLAAFVWRDAEEGLVDLNFRILDQTWAFWLYRGVGVNSVGQITAYGWAAPTWVEVRGYLLTPAACP
jgi:probable HAF family extracellular repeat protein